MPSATEKITECVVNGSAIIPYDGDNEFKKGTAFCTGCGIRVDSTSGLPVPGVTCPVQEKRDITSTIEQSQDIINQLQSSVDEKIDEAVAAAEVESVAKLEAQKVAYDNEIVKIKEDHAAELDAINKSHATAIEKLAKAAPADTQSKG